MFMPLFILFICTKTVYHSKFLILNLCFSSNILCFILYEVIPNFLDGGGGGSLACILYSLLSHAYMTKRLPKKTSWS